MSFEGWTGEIGDGALRICRRHQSEVRASRRWSLCELRLTEADVEALRRGTSTWRPADVEEHLDTANSCRALPNVTRSAALGVLVMALTSELARRTLPTGEVWPALSKVGFRPDVLSLLLHARNQPREPLKRAIEAAVDELHLRHALDEADGQRWYATIALQFGFSLPGLRRGIRQWRDHSAPDAVVRLAADCPGFKETWELLRGDGCDREALSLACRSSAWLLPGWADVLATALAEPRSPPGSAAATVEDGSPQLVTNPRLQWGPSGVHFVCNATPPEDGTTAGTVDLLVDGRRQLRWTRHDGVFTTPGTEVRLAPSGIAMVQLATRSGEVLREQALELLPGEETLCWFDSEGRPRGASARPPRGAPLTLLLPPNATCTPTPDRVSGRFAFFERASDLRVSSRAGELLWETAPSQPRATPPPKGRARAALQRLTAHGWNDVDAPATLLASDCTARAWRFLDADRPGTRVVEAGASRAHLMAGDHYLAQLPLRCATALGAPIGVGESLHLLGSPPFNVTATSGLCVARSVVDPGLIVTAERSERQVGCVLHREVEPDPESWDVLALDRAGQLHRGTWKPIDRLRIQATFPAKPLAMAVVSEGVCLGSWAFPGWHGELRPDGRNTAYRIAAVVRWWKLPFLAPAASAQVRALLVDAPAAWLSAWLAPLSTLRDTTTREIAAIAVAGDAWLSACRRLVAVPNLLEVGRGVRDSADAIVTAFGDDVATAVERVARLHPALASSLLSGFIGAGARPAWLGTVSSSLRRGRTRRELEELLAERAPVRDTDPVFWRTLAEKCVTASEDRDRTSIDAGLRSWIFRSLALDHVLGKLKP